MKLRYRYWVFVPVMVGLLVFAIQRNGWNLPFLSGFSPVLECPEVLDLGEQERGEVVVSRFTIANRGWSQLEITDVQSNCSCTGLEQEGDGGYVRVKSLRLSAGEKQEW